MRSQDKESLTKISNVQYTFHNDLHIIAAYYDNLKVLGKYKNKTRALEVLDEIQEILKPKMVYKNITKDTTGIESINQCFKNNIHFNTNNNADIHFINNTYVYEMPKE